MMSHRSLNFTKLSLDQCSLANKRYFYLMVEHNFSDPCQKTIKLEKFALEKITVIHAKPKVELAYAIKTYFQTKQH